MPVELHWIVDNKVLLVKASGITTPTDAMTALDFISAHTRPNNPVHVVWDAMDVEKNDIGIVQAKDVAVRMAMIKPLGFQLQVVADSVFNGTLSRFLAALVSNMAGLQIRSVKSYEDAASFLRDVTNEEIVLNNLH